MKIFKAKHGWLLSAVFTILMAIALPATTFGGDHGRRERARHLDRKCGKFVNCHDARDGRRSTGRGRVGLTDDGRLVRRDRDGLIRRDRDDDRDFDEDNSQRNRRIRERKRDRDDNNDSSRHRRGKRHDDDDHNQ